MKKTILLFAVLFVFSLITQECFGEISDKWFFLQKNDTAVSIQSTECSIVITPTQNQYVILSSDSNVISSVNSEHGTLYFNFSSAVSYTDAPAIHLQIPEEKIQVLDIYAHHSNIRLPSDWNSLNLYGTDRSAYHINLSGIQQQQINAHLEKDSSIHLLTDAQTDNYRVDCTVLDEKSSLIIDDRFPNMEGKGEYHYIKGTSHTHLNVQLDSDSSLALSTAPE